MPPLYSQSAQQRIWVKLSDIKKKKLFFSLQSGNSSWLSFLKFLSIPQKTILFPLNIT